MCSINGIKSSALGGAAIAEAIGRVSQRSDKNKISKINLPIFFVLLCGFLCFNGSLTSSRSSIRGPAEDAVRKVTDLSAFLFVEFRKRNQLTRWMAAKSKQRSFPILLKLISICSRPVLAYSKAICVVGYHNLVPNVSGKVLTTYLLLPLLLLALFSPSLSLLIALALLLIRAGIEPNPGPVAQGVGADITDVPEFSIISQNCRGLTGCRKACRLIKHLGKSKSKLRIICLQETHCIDKFALNNLFDGSYVVDDGERNQRGVAILIPKCFQINQSRTSGLGRWAIVALNMDESDRPHISVIATVYAPNCHRESKVMFQDFFHNLDALVADISGQLRDPDIVVTGDFNLVLDAGKGMLNRMFTASESNLSSFVKECFSERALCDIDLKDSSSNPFTWRRGSCFSKLDYIFGSPRLAANLVKADIKWHEFGANYDHACLECKFAAKHKSARGRSFPKLFSTDIATDRDRQWIKQQIDLFVQQIPPTWDQHMKLDFIKTMLLSKTLELRQMNKKFFSSESIKEQLNEVLSKPIFTIEDIVNIESLKLELVRVEEQESEILRIKAGVKWREEGERSTRYFLSKFKSRSSACTMYLLKAGSRVISGTVDMLQFIKIFYSQLYNGASPSKKDDLQFAEEFFSNCPRLNNEQCALLAQPLCIEELKAALKSCKDSAPGLDGIPYSFYKAFSDPLLGLLLGSWNQALQSGELAPSHRRPCLTLLPKKGKDLTQLGNWRPIALSACDLKIITKAYADRLKKVLPHILSEAQAAYVPGRDISFNNRILQTAKIHARDSGEDFCVISLDAKKAFDSVSHWYLEQALKAYDFPVEFVQVFQTLYSNLESVVQVNGQLSTIKNGVKQGDALSCGLFVLAIDPLIRNIVKNDFIEGILVPTSQHELEEIKVLAYADDVSIVCRNNDLQPIFTEYERLSLLSGLYLNADKTEIFNLVPSQGQRNIVQYAGTSHCLGRVQQIKICGMTMANTHAEEYQVNVITRINTMESIISGWGRRSLTMNGRMLLAKTFLLSQIVFPSQVFTIGIKEIKKIERLIYSFVNGSRNLYGPEQVARKYLKASKGNGGIDGIDVQSFVSAIALRQYGKAGQLHRQLRIFQALLTAPKDHIGKAASALLKAGLVSRLRENPMPDLQELELISSSPLVWFLSPGSNAARVASQYGFENLFSIQRDLAVGRCPRQRLNSVIRKLPQRLASLVRSRDILDVEPKLSLITATDQCELSSTKSIKLVLSVKGRPPMAVDLNKIHNRQDFPAPGTDEFSSHFRNLCQIKQPALRAIRLKLCYKNIYANERRHRFGLADSPLCNGCNQIESVVHQIFECANAARLWRMYKDITGTEIGSFRDVVLCRDGIENEILKSAIIKTLIHINRNHTVPSRVVAAECAHFLRTEAFVNAAKSPDLMALVNKLANVL